jgi:hypothetical protein
LTLKGTILVGAIHANCTTGTRMIDMITKSRKKALIIWSRRTVTYCANVSCITTTKHMEKHQHAKNEKETTGR